MEPKEEEILGTFLQLENTGEQDLTPVAPKQKKKPKCPPESDKNQKDIQSYFAVTPGQAIKKPKTKESININIERNLRFVLQTKNSVKKINSVKANFHFFFRKKIFLPWI